MAGEATRCPLRVDRQVPREKENPCVHRYRNADPHHHPDHPAHLERDGGASSSTGWRALPQAPSDAEAAGDRGDRAADARPRDEAGPARAPAALELVRKSRGRRKALPEDERSELSALVAKAEPRLFAGMAVTSCRRCACRVASSMAQSAAERDLRARLAGLTLRDEHRLRRRLDRAPTTPFARRARRRPSSASPPPRRRARDHAIRELPGQRAPRGPAGGDRRPPGRRRGGRDRLGQDHPAAQDLPRARARRARHDRPHPAAPARRAHRRRADRRGARRPARRGGRLRRALQRPLAPRHARAADDRRPAARRDPARPAAAPLRHDHHRRGARAQPQHRLPARLPARGSCRGGPT